MKSSIPLFLALFMISPLTLAQTYRWVDENGVVSYSQTPPPSGQAEIVNIHTAPQSGSQDAQERLNKMRQQLEDRREDRKLAKEEQLKSDQEKARRLQNCETARANLRKLEGLGNRLLKTPDGEYRRLTEEERQQRMQKARDNIKENCGK